MFAVRPGSYIRFREVPVEAKTRRWQVVSTSGTPLGWVKFYGAWRCYCFFPDDDTVFNSDCLADIQTFVSNETDAWRESLKQRKARLDV